MFLKWFFFLASDVSTSFCRRVLKRRTYVCRFPFQNLTYAPKGYTCCSNAAAKGKYTDFESSHDFYLSPQCHNLRQNILKGDYSSCPDWCHVIKTGDELAQKSWGRLVVGYGRIFGEYRKLREEMSLEGVYDTFHMVAEDKCNIACKMCREVPGENTISKEQSEKNWNELYRNLSHLKVVHLGGTGEPLIQDESLHFLFNVTKESASNLECVYLITNGLYLTEDIWNQFSPYVKDKLELQISVDAATEGVYRSVRRGGDFKRLLRNLEFLKDRTLRSFTLSMCVQKDNFRDMREFINFSRRYNARPIFGQVLACPSLACDLPEHPDHEEFLKIIEDDEFQAPDVIDYFISRLRK